RGRVLRAGIGGECRGTACGGAGGRGGAPQPVRVRADRARAQGPRHGARAAVPRGGAARGGGGGGGGIGLGVARTSTRPRRTSHGRPHAGSCGRGGSGATWERDRSSGGCSTASDSSPDARG